MGRDLLNDSYGRFYNLSHFLAAQGHEVHLVLFGWDAEAVTERDVAGVHLHSCSVLAATGTGGARMFDSLVRRVEPEWFIGFSDTYFGILAEHFATRYGVGSLIDAYDNYEGYIPWCKPLHALWRRALRRATAITAAGPALLQLMTRDRTSSHAAVVPMAVDLPSFLPLCRKNCRSELDLPQDSSLIGYGGSIAANRGLHTLFDAIHILRRDLPKVRLVLAGRKVGSVSVPNDAMWLGALPAAVVPTVINAMNVVTVVNQLSKFGSYSYPTKLYEAMHCGVPVVATRTPATEWILAKTPELLAEPEDPQSLADRIRYALGITSPDYGPLPTWQESGKILENLLLTVGAGAR
jgi:glycosyltransferase involved in cell wall biosynthesis